MTKDEFLKLKRGDIVCHLQSGNSYVIESDLTNNERSMFIAVRTILISNHSEWEKVEVKSEQV